MPANRPRQHHVLPIAYMAGFTDTGEAGGTIQVFDYSRNRRYSSSPPKVSREKDFYRVYVPNEDEYTVEREMAAIEATVAPFLKEVVLEQTILSPEHLGNILSLAALIAARDRRMRAGQRIALAESLKEHLRTRRISAEKWERIRASEIAAGTASSLVPEYEEACDCALRADWMPVAPHVVQVGMIPDLQAYIVGQLMKRRWELLRVSAAVLGGFITSDSPLVWGRLEELVTLGHNVSIEDAEEITFPVSNTLALVSYSGARSTTVRATKESVAHINMRTLQLSGGLVLHTQSDFLLMRRAGKIERGSAYFEFVKRSRAFGIINP